LSRPTTNAAFRNGSMSAHGDSPPNSGPRLWRTSTGTRHVTRRGGTAPRRLDTFTVRSPTGRAPGRMSMIDVLRRCRPTRRCSSRAARLLVRGVPGTTSTWSVGARRCWAGHDGSLAGSAERTRGSAPGLAANRGHL